MDCPHYIAPRYVVFTDPKTGIEHDCEGTAMCELVDKPCLVEYGNDCDIYVEYLRKRELEDG